MKILHLTILMLLTAFGCMKEDSPEPEKAAPVQTVIYLIRHAEKADASPNPNLSEAGLKRANNWALILKDVAFEAVYSTNYNRTLQTAEPLAKNNNKLISIYDPANFSLENIVKTHSGKNVFIVGHSNTIPPLINAYIGKQQYSDMLENEYGNLYKVTVVDGVVTHGMTVHE